MKCFFTFAVAAAFAIGMNATLWSQTGGTAGASGGTSAAGSAGAGTASAGTAGTPGAAGTANTAGTTGNPGAAGTAGATNGAAASGNVGVGTNGTPALGQSVGTGRGNANARINRAAQPNVNNLNAAQANGQDSFFPGQTPFFNDPRVRQQLSLNDSQFNTLNRSYQGAYARYQQSVNNLSPALTPDQRQLQVQQLQQQFNQSVNGTVNSTFTNPQSLSRYNQLNRQFTGFNNFNDPAIRQQLNLSPDQVRQLRTLQGNWRQRLQQLRRGAGNDLNTADTTQWNQMWQQYASSLNNVLTPEQQQAWAQMSGQPFTFSPNLFMPQTLPDGNVGNVNATPPVGTAVPRGQVNAGAGTTPQGTPVQAGTQTPTGTQPAAQGTTAPATASGTSTQGGTVR
jgi:hypothetical protein